MHFDTKSYLKSNRNHTAKQTQSSKDIITFGEELESAVKSVNHTKSN